MKFVTSFTDIMGEVGKIWINISKIMDDALSSIKKDIQTEVQEKTFEIFLETKSTYFLI